MCSSYFSWVKESEADYRSDALAPFSTKAAIPFEIEIWLPQQQLLVFRHR